MGRFGVNRVPYGGLDAGGWPLYDTDGEFAKPGGGIGPREAIEE